MTLILHIIDAEGGIVAKASGVDEVDLVSRSPLPPGASVRLETGGEAAHVFVRIDDALGTVPLWLPDGVFDYRIPDAEARAAYPPAAFSGDVVALHARRADPWEVTTRRDLALNPLDRPGATRVFPHAEANVETRQEALFAARNVIDGQTATDGHGEWPFTSWGINRNPDAALTVSFGRPVLVDEVVLRLRADFPHDAWWDRATLSFSDGSEVIAHLTKTGARQHVLFSERRIEWIRIDRLIKADDPSPFPALTALSCLGRDV